MPEPRMRAAGSAPTRWLVVMLGFAVLLAGCAAPDEPASEAQASAETAAGTPASAGSMVSCGDALPALDRVGESVQARIREQHAALPPRDERAGLPAELAADVVGVMGMTFMAAWFTDEAEPCLREAAGLAPDDVRWPYYLAQLYRDRGALDESAAFFEQVLRIQPEDPTTLFWLGDIRLEQGRSDEAEPLFARALALFPSSLSARYGLARTALLEEDYRRAADLLEEILARAPDIGAVHYPLGMAYRGLGDDAKAEEHLRRRENAEIRPADPLMAALDSLLTTAGTFENSGLEALDRQEWPAAIEQFRQGLELDPDDPGLRHRLGTALFMVGDLDGAMAEFQRVVRTTPDYFPSHYSIGVLLQETRRHAEAVERFRTALRHRPGDDAVHLRLAISLRHAGDPQSSPVVLRAGAAFRSRRARGPVRIRDGPRAARPLPGGARPVGHRDGGVSERDFVPARAGPAARGRTGWRDPQRPAGDDAGRAGHGRGAGADARSGRDDGDDPRRGGPLRRGRRGAACTDRRRRAGRGCRTWFGA